MWEKSVKTVRRVTCGGRVSAKMELSMGMKETTQERSGYVLQNLRKVARKDGSASGMKNWMNECMNSMAETALYERRTLYRASPKEAPLTAAPSTRSTTKWAAYGDDLRAVSTASVEAL